MTPTITRGPATKYTRRDMLRTALYDLEADPGETRNVVRDRKDLVAERRALLEEKFQVRLPPLAEA